MRRSVNIKKKRVLHELAIPILENIAKG